MVKKSTLDIIEKFNLVLKKKGINVEKIIIYGSALQKRQRIDSDIDSRIEPVPISLESYNKDTWLPFIYEIKKKGIELKI